MAHFENEYMTMKWISNFDLFLYVTQDDKKSLLVTRYMTTLRVELTYPIKEWGHILQNIKQENRH